jgi:hypothetical protein
MSYQKIDNHDELLSLMGELLEKYSTDHLRYVIRECHNGRLHHPVTPKNLHLFRRYRNDPKQGSPDADDLIDAAKLYNREEDSLPADAWDGGFAKNH